MMIMCALWYLVKSISPIGLISFSFKRLSGHPSISFILRYYYYLQVSSPTIIVERAGSFAWTCKSWRVREEFARTVTSAIGLFSSTELPLQRAILPPVCSLDFINKQSYILYSSIFWYAMLTLFNQWQILHLLNDPNPAVREAAVLCIEVCLI